MLRTLQSLWSQSRLELRQMLNEHVLHFVLSAANLHLLHQQQLHIASSKLTHISGNRTSVTAETQTVATTEDDAWYWMQGETAVTRVLRVCLEVKRFVLRGLYSIFA